MHNVKPEVTYLVVICCIEEVASGLVVVVKNFESGLLRAFTESFFPVLSIRHPYLLRNLLDIYQAFPKFMVPRHSGETLIDAVGASMR